MNGLVSRTSSQSISMHFEAIQSKSKQLKALTFLGKIIPVGSSGSPIGMSLIGSEMDWRGNAWGGDHDYHDDGDNHAKIMIIMVIVITMQGS